MSIGAWARAQKGWHSLRRNPHAAAASVAPGLLPTACGPAAWPARGLHALSLPGLHGSTASQQRPPGAACPPPAEEPFSILPLEGICASLEASVAEMHELHSGAARAVPAGSAVPAAAALVARALELPAAEGLPLALGGGHGGAGSSAGGAE